MPLDLSPVKRLIARLPSDHCEQTIARPPQTSCTKPSDEFEGTGRRVNSSLTLSWHHQFHPTPFRSHSICHILSKSPRKDKTDTYSKGSIVPVVPTRTFSTQRNWHVCWNTPCLELCLAFSFQPEQRLLQHLVSLNNALRCSVDSFIIVATTSNILP